MSQIDPLHDRVLDAWLLPRLESHRLSRLAFAYEDLIFNLQRMTTSMLQE